MTQQSVQTTKEAFARDSTSGDLRAALLELSRRKTREEADRVLEETIAKIAAKQTIERARAKPES